MTKREHDGLVEQLASLETKISMARERAQKAAVLFDELCTQLAARDKTIERLQEKLNKAVLDYSAAAWNLDDIVNLIEEARSAIGAVDGYDYRSGEEYGLRTALLIITKYRAALQENADDADA